PLVSLAALLGLEETAPSDGDSYGALLSIGGRQFAVQIDAVLQTEEIVVKPISATLRHLALYSGCTILGDGAVVLILEPNGLARLVLGEAADAALDMPPVEEAAPASSAASALLIVRTEGQRQALSLGAITRLEHIALNRLEWSGAQAVLHYQGRLMPVARLAGALTRDMAGDAVCIVLHHQGKSFGLLCDAVLDVTESAIDLSFDPSVDGMLGTAIVQGVATDIVDGLYYFVRFFPDMIAAVPRDGAMRPLLLIERDSFFRDMLTPVLRAAGYAVIAMDDPAQAVAHAASCAAMIIDCDAAAQSEAMHALCAAGRGAPLIGLSSALDDGTRDRLRGRGVTALVSKFDRRGLVAMLRQAIPPAPAVQEAA
ncbi:MAG: chemotaxis protein CheW, partial [Beijerinckiaceae bacterium]